MALPKVLEDARRTILLAAALFRKFQRLENAEQHGIGGTGLGLALVREIVEAHGGGVAVTTRQGEGSTFSFVLRAELDREATVPC